MQRASGNDMTSFIRFLRATRPILGLVIACTAVWLGVGCQLDTATLADLKKTVTNEQPEIDLQLIVERIHVLINSERTTNGLRALAVDDEMTAIAQNHSFDMATNNYFAPENLQGLSPTDRGAAVGYDCIKRYGDYYTFGLAENIHQGWLFSSTTYINGVPIRDWNTQEEIAVSTVRGWMKSQGQRENILTNTYDRAGVGVAISQDGKVYITQNFC